MTQARLNFESFDVDEQVRQCLAKLLKASKLSRVYIAAAVQEISGQKCSETILHAWTAPSKENYRIPACVVPSLCHELNDFSLFDLLLKPTDRRLATPDEVRLSALGELHQRRADIESQIRKLEG